MYRRTPYRLFVTCLALLGASALAAQVTTYDFNSLSGSDAHPFTNLDGQDGWTSQGYIFLTPTANLQMGVTATLGFDGTPALRFQDSGAGYGVEASHLRDGGFPLPLFSGEEALIFFQADFSIGAWWGDLALAHDANGDGEIRVPVDATEVGPMLRIGANDATAGVALVAADGTVTRVPLATIGATGDQWVRLRLAIDPRAQGGAGSGTVLAQNLTAGETQLVAVPGLENIPLALDQAAADGRNPALWDAVFLHFEGSTYQLDNLAFGTVPAPYEIPVLAPLGVAVFALALVAGGLLVTRRRRRA